MTYVATSFMSNVFLHFLSGMLRKSRRFNQWKHVNNFTSCDYCIRVSAYRHCANLLPGCEHHQSKIRANGIKCLFVLKQPKRSFTRLDSVYLLFYSIFFLCGRFGIIDIFLSFWFWSHSNRSRGSSGIRSNYCFSRSFRKKSYKKTMILTEAWKLRISNIEWCFPLGRGFSCQKRDEKNTSPFLRWLLYHINIL